MSYINKGKEKNNNVDIYSSFESSKNNSFLSYMHHRIRHTVYVSINVVKSHPKVFLLYFKVIAVIAVLDVLKYETKTHFLCKIIKKIFPLKIYKKEN